MRIDWNGVFETGMEIVKSTVKSTCDRTVNDFDRLSRDRKYTDEQRERARDLRDEFKMKKDMYLDDDD